MRVSFARWEPVGTIDDGPRPHLNRALVLHTAVSSASDLHDFWQSGAAGSGVGAHFYVNKQGTLFQYLDTDRKTGHAWAANDFALGCESWDGADPVHVPWNQAQLNTIVKLAKELGCPAVMLKDSPSDGIGYHEQYADWNLSHHTCPGSLREKQIQTDILPALTGDTMTKDDIAKLFGFANGQDMEDALDAGRALDQRAQGVTAEPAASVVKRNFDYLRDKCEGAGGAPPKGTTFNATVT